MPVPDLGTVLAQVAAERERQDDRWGGMAHDDTHDPQEWIDLVHEHADRATKAAPRRGRGDRDEYRARMIAIAAVAVAAVQAHDRHGDGA